jgi:carboxypeptidase PM20D1
MHALRWIGLVALLLVLPAAAPAAPPSQILSEAIRFATVSHQDPEQFDGAVFRAFHRFLAERFPAVHAGTIRHEIGFSLLFEWVGREPALAPILLTSHFDVVPVPDGSEDDWTHPPFRGAIADGYVWGRGALDDKAGVIAMLAAVEGLIEQGYQPRRTVWLAFGHDEEVGGEQGAGAITDWLEARGVRVLFSLDEGMAIVTGALPGVDRPLGLIGIAEKGYLTLRVTAHAVGGHSSTPPRTTAIGKLARAIQRIEDSPLPARSGGAADAMFDALAPHMPWTMGLSLRARAWLGPLVDARLSAEPVTNAMIRTTTAVTVVEGGVKENVLPDSATATVNFRLIPGDTTEGVRDHIVAAIDDPAVTVEMGRRREASSVADPESAAFGVLRDAILQVAPDAVVAPGLVVGGTDSKHYGRIADNAFRFTPFRLGPGDLSRIHGTDERVAVENLDGDMVPFYRDLLRRVDAID